VNKTGLFGEAVTWSRDGTVLLDQVTIGVWPGEVVALLGANGAGKSSLLRILLGLLPCQQGRIWLDGQLLGRWSRAQRARRISYVPQNPVWQLPFTVRSIVELGLIPHAGMRLILGSADRDRIDHALASVGILALAERSVATLSGGERQRVALARALAQQARLLILDEPTSALDFGEQLRLYELLRSLAAKGHGVLYTTHQPQHVRHVADSAVLLHRSRVLAAGPVCEVLTPHLLSTLYDLSPRVIAAHMAA
jgi:iron complex transport system ATP-binding protein